MDDMVLLGDWHRLCVCGKAAAIIVLLALIPCSQMAVQNFPINTPTPTPEGDTLVENVNFELLPSSEQQPPSQSEERNYNHGDESQEEDLDGDAEVIVSLPEDGEHWKTKIIIGCTVTAAVEILVVIFIIAYWREIRWTLRKFSCPCDDSNHNNHEAMERRQPATSSEADVAQVYGVQHHHETNTYSVAGQQEDEEEDEDEDRITEEVCLETSSV